MKKEYRVIIALLLIAAAIYLWMERSSHPATPGTVLNEPCGQTGELVRHKEFSLRYSDAHKQAYWVAYTLQKEELQMHMKREDYFAPDPEIDHSAKPDDYRRSGYDRGHLSRAEYNKSSVEAYKESFYMSNMSPQVGEGFNRAGGLWYKSEELEEQLCRKFGILYDVSGPVFGNSPQTIGEDHVTVPEMFFKIITYRDAAGQWQSKGLLMRNAPDKVTEPTDCIVPVRKIEELTGLDFNCGLLSPEEQQRVEN